MQLTYDVLMFLFLVYLWWRQGVSLTHEARIKVVEEYQTKTREMQKRGMTELAGQVLAKLVDVANQNL